MGGDAHRLVDHDDVVVVVHDPEPRNEGGDDRRRALGRPLDLEPCTRSEAIRLAERDAVQGRATTLEDLGGEGP
jgi:hypothetical protein